MAAAARQRPSLARAQVRDSTALSDGKETSRVRKFYLVPIKSTLRERVEDGRPLPLRISQADSGAFHGERRLRLVQRPGLLGITE